MRANPLVCVEVDKIVRRQEWQSIVIFGRYQELLKSKQLEEAHQFAHDLLARKAHWWEPGFAKTVKDGVERRLERFFRIVIDEISGHEATRCRLLRSKQKRVCSTRLFFAFLGCGCRLVWAIDFRRRGEP